MINAFTSHSSYYHLFNINWWHDWNSELAEMISWKKIGDWWDGVLYVVLNNPLLGQNMWANIPNNCISCCWWRITWDFCSHVGPNTNGSGRSESAQITMSQRKWIQLSLKNYRKSSNHHLNMHEKKCVQRQPKKRVFPTSYTHTANRNEIEWENNSKWIVILVGAGKWAMNIDVK